MIIRCIKCKKLVPAYMVDNEMWVGPCRCYNLELQEFKGEQEDTDWKEPKHSMVWEYYHK